MGRERLEAVDLSQNHYDVLEVNARTATQADMKRSFRRLCLKYHPDKGGAHATDQFHRIKIAYDTLSDPKQKVKFDQAYFYARHSVPRNFKRIPQPSPVEPSSKRPRVHPTTAAAAEGGGRVTTSSSGVTSPTETVSGSTLHSSCLLSTADPLVELGVSPPSDEAAMGDGNLESMSITKLKCIAKARAIDIATCIEKADIINAIRKGLEETSASGTAGGDEEKDEARPMGSSVAARGGAGDDDPTLHKEGDDRCRKAAYERELASCKDEMHLSNESLAVSTTLVDNLSKLQRMLDSTAAYATDHSSAISSLRSRVGTGSVRSREGLASVGGSSTLSPSGRFSSAMQCHMGSLLSGANAITDVKNALCKLSERLRDVMKDIKRSDAELIVSGRGVSGEIRRYEELVKKLSEPTQGSMLEGNGDGQNGEKDGRKININRLVGLKDSCGASSFDSGKRWSDLLPPGTRRGRSKGDLGGGDVKDSHKSGSATATTTSVDSNKPIRVAPARAVDETSQCGDESVKVNRKSLLSRRRPVTVKIPELWEPGRKVQFFTDYGVVRFIPPESSSPGDLMTFDPPTRRVRKRPPIAFRTPQEGHPRVVREESGKEFVLVD